jgi:hypothetical protein
VTADTRRQLTTQLVQPARWVIRGCATLIALSAGVAAWQLAFRPPLDRLELITELAVVCALAVMNILAQRVIRGMAAVIILMLGAVDAAAAAVDQPGDELTRDTGGHE